MGVKFKPVTNRHEFVAIVASGPSAKGLTLPFGFCVIAVNGAINWLNRADYFFTLDVSKVNRARLIQQRHGTKYFAAVPKNFGANNAKTHCMRLRPPVNVHYLKRLTGDGFFGSKSGLAEDTACIHTGNSAYGALGLAYHFRPQKICLFGVDGNNLEKIEGGYPNNLEHLPKLFFSAIDQLKKRGIALKLASPYSKVTCFETCDMKKGVEWLMG